MSFLPRLWVAVCVSGLVACGGSSSTTFDDTNDASVDDGSTSGDGSADDTGGSTSDGTSTEGGGDETSTTTEVGGDGTPSDTPVPPDETVSCAGDVCGTVCTDKKTDPKNCGTCGNEVCHNEACAGGMRVCAPGLKPCGGAGGCLGCKNEQSDPSNCGACGKVCNAAETCVKGVCTLGIGGGCSGGLTKCGKACVDTSRDITNCGGCGTNCSPGEFCADSKCTPYVPAPGCTMCPCAACAGATDKCCRYADGTVCASKCISG